MLKRVAFAFTGALAGALGFSLSLVIPTGCGLPRARGDAG